MTQTLIEKLEALKSEAITVHGEYNSGIDRAISIARQHTDDQSRELDEARKLNAELVAAMMPFVRFVEFQRLKEKLDGCEPKPETGIASVMDGEDGVHLEWRDLLAVKEAFDKSQPHRPQPAAGEL